MRRDCLLGVMIHHIMFLLFFGIDFFFFWNGARQNGIIIIIIYPIDFGFEIFGCPFLTTRNERKLYDEHGREQGTIADFIVIGEKQDRKNGSTLFSECGFYFIFCYSFVHLSVHAFSRPLLDKERNSWNGHEETGAVED